MARPFPLPEDLGIERPRAATAFYRAAAATMYSHLKKCTPEKAVRDLFNGDRNTEFLLTKAARSPARTDTNQWAMELAATTVVDTVMELATVSAAAALFQRSLQLSFGSFAYIKAPGRLVDASDAGSWVAEGNPISVRAQRITAGALLEPRKLM